MAQRQFEVALVLSASDRASAVIANATAKAEKQMRALSGAGDKAFDFGKKSGGVGLGLTAILAGPLKAAADMESMNVSLQTSFQGNQVEAKKAFDAINKFAAKTPYGLEEVMTGFIKLKNMGLDPSEDALQAYGNTASAMGKSLNDMVEAVADATTGEFERLKEFGIKANSEGNKVTFTFQGVKTTVGKNSKEIEQYLKYIGNVKFAGGIEAQSKTTKGMISTLTDGVVMSAAKIGTTFLPQVKSMIESVSKVTDKVAAWVTKNPQLTGTIMKVVAGAAALSFAISGLSFVFGGLFKIISAVMWVKKAYIVLTNLERSAEAGNAAAKTILAIKTGALSAAKWVLNTATNASVIATGAATAAQWLFNTSLYGCPIVWIIAGIIAVIAIVVLLVKNWDKVSAFFKGLFDKVKNIFSAAWDFIKKWGLLMLGPIGWIIKYWDKIRDFFVGLWAKVKAIFWKALDFYLWLPRKFFSIGSEIVMGIWNGIKAKATALFDYVKEVGKKIAGAFKSVLGIASPSKVFTEFGINITEGAKKGIEKGAPGVVNASSGMGRSITPNVAAGRSSSGASGASVNVTFAPVINGGGNAQDMAALVESLFPAFMRKMQDAMNRQKRLSY